MYIFFDNMFIDRGGKRKRGVNDERIKRRKT